MPGIAGVVVDIRNADGRRQRVDQMLHSLIHEPWYRYGQISVESLGIQAGWACLPQSFGEKQPFVSGDQQRLLLLSGESFAQSGLLDDLAKPGQKLDPASGEWVLSLYESSHSEKDFLCRLNGSCSGLLVDRERSLAILFNDRWGAEPIYWHASRDCFYFASKPGALLNVLPGLRTLDSAGLAQHFALGSAMGENTLFAGVKRSEPGTFWCFRCGRASPSQRYFDLGAWTSQGPLPGNEYSDLLREKFAALVPRYFHSSGPLGLSLTGGIDTRLILAQAWGQISNLPCYTFAGIEGDTIDVKIARRVAGAIGQKHKVVRLGRDFLTGFQALCEESVLASDGAADLSLAHEIYLNRKARPLSPVRLTGNFGSEVLRGHSTFKPLFLRSKVFEGGLRQEIDRAGRALADSANGMQRTLQEISHRILPTVLLGQSQVVVRTPYLDQDLVELACRAPASPLERRRIIVDFLNELSPSLAEIPTDRGPIGTRRPIRGRLKRSWSQASFRLEYFLNEGLPSKLLRFEGLFAPFADKVKPRHKYLRYRSWLQNELSGFVAELLLDPSALKRPYLVPTQVERVVSDHLSRRANCAPEICWLGAMELTHRLVIEGSSTDTFSGRVPCRLF